MPALMRADDRRVAGWRAVREFLSSDMYISDKCPELIRCMSALTYDKNRPEDCSDSPHDITHLPEALRYAVMSRIAPPPDPSQSSRHRYRGAPYGVPVSKY